MGPDRQEKRESGQSETRRIELPAHFSKRRIVLAVVLLVLGATAQGYGMNALLSRSSGWTEIEVSPGAAENSGGDLTFQYLLGADATAVYRRLTELYTEAAERTYAVYHAGKAFSGVQNVYTVNANVNRAVAVEPELYAAFEAMERSGQRYLYLAPVYDRYEGMFRSGSDEEARAFDPFRDPETAALVADALPYVNDPESVSLELLGDGRVCLHMSEDYLRFAEENGIDCFIDFYWMKNAFVVDQIAGVLREQGFTRGYLTSADGFGCCLDGSGEGYSIDLYAREGRRCGRLAYWIIPDRSPWSFCGITRCPPGSATIISRRRTAASAPPISTRRTAGAKARRPSCCPAPGTGAARRFCCASRRC